MRPFCKELGELQERAPSDSLQNQEAAWPTPSLVNEAGETEAQEVTVFGKEGRNQPLTVLAASAPIPSNAALLPEGCLSNLNLLLSLSWLNP